MRGPRESVTVYARKRCHMMYDSSNPYASPTSADIHPVAAQWMGTPSPSLQRVANGLGMIFAGNILILVAVIGGIGMAAALARDAATLAMIDNLVSIAALVAF